ncbi:MAG: aspartate/glutamate racemase family protein [Candidatus Aminicenantes bacterium]
MNKTIGILGGMGPEATAYFFELIIKKTEVKRDQDHIPVFMYSNPMVPPRTDAFMKKGPSPVPLLVDGLRRLRRAGADFMVMPCVTAHYFLPEVLAQEKFPVVSLIEESLGWARRNIPRLKTAGLISSTGTLKSRLFHEAFGKNGIEIMGPEEGEQDKVMEAIFGNQGIKAGYTSGEPKKIIIDTARRLIQKGAQAVIAGCTEVPLVLKQEDISVPLIEPLSIAAEACILKAGRKLRGGKAQKKFCA